MWREIGDREAGKIRPISFTNRVKSSRIGTLELSNYKDIVSPHKGAINSLQVDLTEERYLLSGSSDASAAVYDVQRATDYEGGGLIAKHRSILAIDKKHEHGHKYAISSAIWYPIDTGLFITGSYDHYIKVWDTNTTQMVVNFKMPGKVHRASMSPLATSHMLIAAGTEDVQVRLCDIASGAFAHTLSGHRDGVMTVEWSTSSEWVLVTGGCDGAIRFWDIRRAGCFLVLDQSQTQFGRRLPIRACSSMNKDSASRKLPSKSLTPQGKSSRKSEKISLLDRNPAKGLVRKRLHPGMLSSQDHSTAHYGVVTGLKITEDGMYLLSAANMCSGIEIASTFCCEMARVQHVHGSTVDKRFDECCANSRVCSDALAVKTRGSDSRIRLWDIESGCNTLVNFETMRLQTNKAIQLATSRDSALVFVPCMTVAKAFDFWSGKTYLTFRGHYEYVNCCWFSLQDQELYTGGNDRQIIVWSPSRLMPNENGGDAQDQDNWSD